MNRSVSVSVSVSVLFAVVVLAVGVTGAGAAEDIARMRKLSDALMREIELEFRETAAYTGRSTMQPAVAAAMREVSRHDFVADEQEDYAYINRPLPIGHGQTISQPYIVALMTDLIDPRPDFRVLEIGTGSGYQAAVLAEVVAEVYTIEIIEALAEQAAERLRALGYDNINVRAGDGNHGWPEAAPFDAIVVTAGGEIPPALVAQLKPGGRMVIPVDVPGGQELTVVSTRADGTTSAEGVLPVRFVPLTGDN